MSYFVMMIISIYKNQIFTEKCENGKECIEKIEEKRTCKCKVCNTNYYKLIILDVLMPVMDGIQAVKTIQEMIDTQKINQETNVVLLSAHIDDNLITTLANIKCIKEFIKKPVKKEKIKNLIDTYCIGNSSDLLFNSHNSLKI